MTVPRPARFADGRPEGEVKILAAQDGRRGFNDDSESPTEEQSISQINAGNKRDLP